MRFHSGEIAVQERAHVRDTAEDVGESITSHVAQGAKEFLERRQMAVLGTVDGDGHVWASVVTGERGFIWVADERTITILAQRSASDPLFDNLVTERHVALFAPDFVSAQRIRINGLGKIEAGEIRIRTQQVYGNCRRYMQERIFLGPRAIAPTDEVGAAAARGSALSALQQEQISKADTLFIATHHPEHGADVSHKGGKPGFVRIDDPRRIAIPDYNGNSMFNTLGNLVVNSVAGLLFIDFDGGRTLQLSGSASIDWNPERVRTFAGAERIVDFAIAEVIENPFGFPLQSRFRQFSRFNP
jgi:predicted pyridoxine 5'-phosphate oxidase superfamily flavin-nucleotide-binding protein